MKTEPENTKRKKKGHGCLITFLCIILIFCVIILIVILAIDKSGMSASPSTISGKYIEDLNDEQAKEIDDILSQCGISNISEITHDELLDNAHENGETGYRISADYSDNIILYLNPDKTVRFIIYADNKLYSKGKVKANINDYIIDVDEVNDLMIKCEEVVKSVLKSPSTANFPDYTEWGFQQHGDGIYLVSGYVDAQNGFGAEIRSYFSFEIKNGTIESFVFEGQKMINNS